MNTTSSLSVACDLSGASLEDHLLPRCLEGDAQAWDLFFDRFHPPIAAFLFKLSCNFERYEVEDICQKVFLRAIRELGNFDGRCKLWSWLLGIALEETRNFGRSPDLPLTQDSQNGEPDASDWLGKQLEQLDDFHRGLLELYYFGALSHEEIAAVLRHDLVDITLGLRNALDELRRTHNTRVTESIRGEPGLIRSPIRP